MSLRTRLLLLAAAGHRRLVPRAWTIPMLRAAFHLFPRARRHLDHYLLGHGTPLPVDTAELLRRESDVGRHFAAAIRSDAERGVVRIPQWRIRSLDWRFALGSFDLVWQRVKGGVAVACDGVYAWTPGGDRPTRDLHRALDARRCLGARAYRFTGIPCLVSAERLYSRRRQKTRPPTDRLYM